MRKTEIEELRESENEPCIILLSACRQLIIVFIVHIHVDCCCCCFLLSLLAPPFNVAFHSFVIGAHKRKENSFFSFCFPHCCMWIHLFNWKNWLWHTHTHTSKRDCMVFYVCVQCTFLAISFSYLVEIEHTITLSFSWMRKQSGKVLKFWTREQLNKEWNRSAMQFGTFTHPHPIPQLINKRTTILCANFLHICVLPMWDNNSQQSNQFSAWVFCV